MKKKGKNYLAGAIILSAGALISKLLGMFFKIPLNDIIGDYGMGLYSYAYPIYSTFLMISISGLPLAVSKLVSESVSLGNYKQAYRIFYVSFVLLAVVGGACSIAMFSGAKLFIRAFSWEDDVYYCIVALSIAPFFVSLISVVRGFFQGMQMMTFSAISEIIEQIGRVFIGLALAYLLTSSNGISLGAAGATFGAVAGAILAFLFLYICFLRVRSKNTTLINEQPEMHIDRTKTILKHIMIIAIPVTFSAVVTTIMDLINSATISGCLQTAGYTIKEATTLYGQLSTKGSTLVNVPLVLGTSLATSLVPSVSESLVKGDNEAIRSKATLSIRMAFLVSIPAAVGLSILSEPIVKLLWTKNPEGWEMLAGLSYVVICTIGASTMQGMLQGIGRYYVPLKNLLVGALVKYVMNILLVSNSDYGIYGAIFSSVFASFVIFILNFYSVKKYIGIDNIAGSIFKTTIAAILMGVSCKFSYDFLCTIISFKIALLISIVVAVAVYALVILLTKTFTMKDFKNARS